VLVGCKLGETGGDGALQIRKSAGGGVAQMALELGKGHFNGVEVGAIGRQIAHGGAFGLDQPGDGRGLVDAEVVEDDDIAGVQFWAQRTCPTYAAKTSMLAAPSIRNGASIRSRRKAAMKVEVCQ